MNRTDKLFPRMTTITIPVAAMPSRRRILGAAAGAAMVGAASLV